jgi:hypothetical protein
MLVFYELLVPLVGIEPTRVAPHDFESCAYTSSATAAQANHKKVRIYLFGQFPYLG